MSELKYLWLFVFISIPTAFFLEAPNIKAGFVHALFAAGIIAAITFFLHAVYLGWKSDFDRGVF